MTHLILTVRFLDDRYHGLLDRGGPPEWPPSPFRLFQALVAGVARRRELVVGDDVPSNTNFTPIGNALGWLQRHTRDHPPIIIAPKAKSGQAITRFVPNNDGDKKFDRQVRLTAKHTEPTLFVLERDEKPEVHYVWGLARKTDCPIADIERAARSLTTLGWGIDMAFADAWLADEAEPQRFKGIRWYPKKSAGSFRGTLRTPTCDEELGECTLCDLRHCHSTFINRIEHGKPLKTVDKPKIFDRVHYTSIERPIGQPNAVFRLLDDNDDFVAYPHAKLIHLAGMVRHLAIKLMKQNPPRELRGLSPQQWVDQYVAGHKLRGDERDGPPHTQFSYIPLPSTGYAHTNPAIRRVMIVAPLGDEIWLEHLAVRLDGERLKPLPSTTIRPGTRLERIPEIRKDGVRNAYTDESCAWASFTPVILPGFDDHKPAKMMKLIRKALAQAGIEQPCEFEWSAFSRFPKSYSAHKYDRGGRMAGYIRPNHLLTQTAVHVTLRFHDGSEKKLPISVPGPIAIGAGRFCGFGLFAKDE